MPAEKGLSQLGKAEDEADTLDASSTGRGHSAGPDMDGEFGAWHPSPVACCMRHTSSVCITLLSLHNLPLPPHHLEALIVVQASCIVTLMKMDQHTTLQWMTVL